MVFIARRISPTALSPTDPGYEAPQQDVLRRPQVLFHDWTPGNLQPHDENVEVYSNCKEVELFLNNQSLGKKPLNADASPRNWQVPFTPGRIKAVARDENGKVVATDELQTAGKAERILLTASRRKISNDWNDVCKVIAEVTDDNGVVVPSANNLISFEISGAGRIAAVDNADNSSHEPFQASERRAYKGGCVVFLKGNAASGRIQLSASSPDLKRGRVVIEGVK